MRPQILLLSFALLLMGNPLLAGSSDTGKIHLYIIGVNHKPAKNRNADSLMVLLRDIRPDLILSETDTLSGYFKKDYTLVHPAWWYKLAMTLGLARKMPPEDEVIYPYRKLDPTVAVYPFDMALPDRNEFVKQLTRREQQWVDDIQEAYLKQNIPSSLDSTYHALMDIYHQFYNEGVFRGTYRNLNQKALTDSLRGMVAREEQLSKILADSVPALTQYREWHQSHYSFWAQRNEVMAMNIIRFADMTKAKRVVVFTGLLHKYYLEDRLGSEPYRNRYEIKDYFSK